MPQQNDVAKRFNRTLMAKVRSLLSTTKFDKRFWIESVSMTCHLINRAPTKLFGLKISEEL